MLRHLLYPLLPYRSFLFPILVLAAIVVPCWLVFRLYRLRSRAEPLSVGREVMLVIFVVYLCGLAAATLSPNRSSRLLAAGTGGIELRPNLTALTCSPALAARGSSIGTFCAYNAKGNLMLFFPLGLLLPLVWRRLRFWQGILIALALSVSIEILQYVSSAWGSYRAADVNDVILNVVGASLGLAVIYLVRLPNRTRPVVARA